MRLLFVLVTVAAISSPLSAHAKGGSSGGSASSTGHSSQESGTSKVKAATPKGSIKKTKTVTSPSHVPVWRGDSGTSKVTAAPNAPKARVLQLDGIEGESTDAKHKDTIEIESLDKKTPPPPPPKQ